MRPDEDKIDADDVLFWGAVVAAGLLPFGMVLWSRSSERAPSTLPVSRRVAYNALDSAEAETAYAPDEQWSPAEREAKLEAHRAESRRAVKRMALEMVQAGLGQERVRYQYAGVDQSDSLHALMPGGPLGALRRRVDADVDPELARAISQVDYATTRLDPKTYAGAVANLWRAAGGTCFPNKVTADEAAESILEGSATEIQRTAVGGRGGQAISNEAAAKRLALACGVLPGRDLPASVEELRLRDSLHTEWAVRDRALGRTLTYHPMELPEGSRSYLAYADLRGANLRNMHLEGASLEHANLRNAMLIGTKLTGANLSDATMDEADVRHADLRGANVKAARFIGAHLEHVDFRNANLRSVAFSGAHLDKASFEDADITGAHFGGAYTDGANFENARSENGFASNRNVGKTWAWVNGRFHRNTTKKRKLAAKTTKGRT